MASPFSADPSSWTGAGIRRLRTVLTIEPAIPGSTAFDPDTAAQIRAAQVGAVARFSKGVVIGNTFNAVIIITAFLRGPLAGAALTWGFLLISYSSFLYLRTRGAPGKAAPRYVSHRAVWRAVLHAGVMGVLWGAAPILFFQDAASEQLLLASLGIGMVCAGCFVLATIPVAAMTFIVPLTTATAIALARGGQFGHYMIVLLLISYIFALLAAASTHATQFMARVQAHIQAEREARRDALTGLPNRTAFLEALEKAVDRCMRYGEGFALFSMDLDGFKAVNDRLGHPVGDQLLAQVGARLGTGVRDRDTLARISGDEFMLLMPGVHHPDRAVAVAERLLSLFSAPVMLDGEEVQVRLSVGVSLAPRDGAVASELLERADTALYQVKREGKNAFRLFRRDDEVQARRRKSWSLDLRKAIARGEMFLMFQPILHVGSGNVAGFEALLRWNHPEQGPISPADFIPLAEKTGLIHEIGDWVIAEACRAAATWPDHVKVAVNFSLDQFRSRTIVSTILDALARHDLGPERFEIEVTESILLQDEATILDTVAAIKRAGLRLVLDDFGTGFSSLRLLQELPIDGLKIDRSFTNGLPDNRRSMEIVRAVIQLGVALDLRVTAEGIETAEQMATLRALGCDDAQGFWLGRPQPEEAALQICHARSGEERLVA